MAQTGSWSAPASNYVYDQATHSIRDMKGFLGSASLGVSLVDGIEWASVAPDQKSAILRRTGLTVWIPDLGIPDVSTNLDLKAVRDQVFWATDSGRAVALTTDAKLAWINLVSSPGAPLNVEASWDLAQFSAPAAVDHNAGWAVLAADSQADRVLLRKHDGDGWQLWLAAKNTTPFAISFTGHAAAAAFTATGSAVLVADSALHQISRIQNLDATPTLTPLLWSERYLADPAGIALSVDGKRLFAADRINAGIGVFDVATGELLTELEGDVSPQSLSQIGPERYLLNLSEGSPQPLFILDTREPARVVFVPGGQ